MPLVDNKGAKKEEEEENNISINKISVRNICIPVDTNWWLPEAGAGGGSSEPTAAEDKRRHKTTQSKTIYPCLLELCSFVFFYHPRQSQRCVLYIHSKTRSQIF